jgi:hypothetical protein
MHHRTHFTVALGLACTLLAPAQAQTPSPIELGLQAIVELAQVNGQALACQEMKVAGRAKNLMIAHAPKTARFGNAYEEGTQQSYTAQMNGTQPCADAATFSVRLDALAQRLQTALPALAPDAAPINPTGTQ